MAKTHRHPFVEMVRTRALDFLRQPEAIFWAFGFPMILVIALGIAFRNRPVDKIHVCMTAAGMPEATAAALRANDGIVMREGDTAACGEALRLGKVQLALARTEAGGYETRFDPTQPESAMAKAMVEDLVQRAEGRKDVATFTAAEMKEPGGRYIDFLVPGLIGFSIMSGGLWGVGFAVADMRMRKLLKKMRATPMRRDQFLLGIAASRLLFLLPETTVLLLFGWIAFDVQVRGSLLAILALCVVGALAFAAIGLALGSRARTMEAIMGLINLASMPMWMLCGIFFSRERFPDAVQPLLKALPLSPLVDGLRLVTQEGASLAGVATHLAILGAWAVVSFAIAMRLFRWT
jgi:ABC-type multidrug transport system permease subunit